jgi:hypothetical protein
VGSTDARQVHQSFPSPDETYVAVANQNGKLYERINTDYKSNTFVLDHTARIDLATCTTPNLVACQLAGVRPDNAPICPIIESNGVLNFVTLRGGGLFVIDAKSTPMRIVAEYDMDTIHPNGCLGAQVGNKMYVDSGVGPLPISTRRTSTHFRSGRACIRRSTASTFQSQKWSSAKTLKARIRTERR